MDVFFKVSQGRCVFLGGLLLGMFLEGVLISFGALRGHMTMYFIYVDYIDFRGSNNYVYCSLAL